MERMGLSNGSFAEKKLLFLRFCIGGAAVGWAVYKRLRLLGNKGSLHTSLSCKPSSCIQMAPHALDGGFFQSSDR